MPDSDGKYLTNTQDRLQTELQKTSARLENMSLEPFVKVESSIPEEVDLVKVQLESSIPEDVNSPLVKLENVNLLFSKQGRPIPAAAKNSHPLRKATQMVCATICIVNVTSYRQMS